MNYEELLLDLITNDNKYFVLTSENRAMMRNLPPKFKDNFIDCGIAEQTMIGIASGLALRGRFPIVHALATFLTMRPFEFIRSNIGLQNLPIKIMGSVSGFLSDGNGPTHQAVEDISLMRGIPNIKVFCPADENDMMKCLPKIFSDPSPYYIRFNAVKSIVEHNEFEFGKAETFGNGKEVAILVYGFLFAEAFKAKEILESKGLSVRLINVRSLKPIDEEMVLNTIEECKLIVTIEDHFITGGLYSILAEVLLTNKKTTNVLPIALMDKWFKPGILKDVLEYEGFTSEKIAEKIFNKYL